MTKHTPGPWRSQYSNDVGPDDDYFVEFFEVTSEDGTKIAQVEEEKDARLIASSPDLLAALKYIDAMPCTEVNDSESLRHTIKTLRHIARAAIAKAWGEA
jgi:hypothetical protein